MKKKSKNSSEKKMALTTEEKAALIGKIKKIPSYPSEYTIKEIWEHSGFTLCSFIENNLICNVEILKDPPPKIS